MNGDAFAKLAPVVPELARQLVHALDEPACLCDVDGRFLAYNEAAVRFWGTAPTDEDRWCVHTQIFRAGNALSHEQLPPVAALLKGGPVEAHDLELVRRDGTRVRYSVHAAPVRDDSGVIIGMLARVRDPATRRDLELARGRLTAIVQSSDDAIISTDLNGVITSWNLGAQRLYGYEAHEVIGHPTRVLMPPERRDEEPEVLARIRNGDIVDHYETIRRRKDGSEVAVSLTVSPMVDDAGLIVGASKIARDVSDRQAADLVQNRLAAIVESSDDAIISKNLEGTIVTWNRGAERVFGYASHEVVGKSITILIPPDRLDEEPTVLGKISRGEAIEHFETVRRRKDGSLIDISLTISPIRNSKGVIVGALKIARDITERKRAEQRLAEADRRKDEFLATLSHELRNPLAPLRTSLDLLAGAPLTGSLTQRMVTIMRRQVDHLVRLVDDLLEVSRISRGAIALEKEVLLLGEVMQDAIEISRPLLERKDQKLTMQMPTAAPAVLGDRVRLVQVISNVLNNASKFTPVGGRIAVLLSAEGESAVLRVIDNGVGIDPQHLESIFEMFHQVGHGAHSTGMGVGLSLARRLVQMHGGSVRALSAGAGQGTEIRIQIPLQRLASVTTDDSPESPQPPQATTRRLLVVDDNRDAAEVLSAFLNALGHETHVAHDGPAALATAERVRPDVVLLDIGMPGMSGYEVAEALRKRDWGRNLLLIALTGWGQASDRERSQQAGFDHHLVKPVDMERLLGVLKRSAHSLH